MSASLPPNAPYEIEVGHEVEIRVFLHPDREGILVAECTMGDDPIGWETELPEGDLEQTLAVDALVQGMADFVWRELLGTPTFRDEDDKWVGRVAAQASWVDQARVPTLGYVLHEEPVEAAPPPVEDDPAEPESAEEIVASLGDVDVTDLRLSQDEMAALTRGEVPEALMRRAVEARSTENLIGSALSACEQALESGYNSLDIERAVIELREVLRRFAS